MFGGFADVSLTDYFQGILVVVGTAVLGIYMISYASGWSNVVEQVTVQDPTLAIANMGAAGSTLFGNDFWLP